MTTLDDLLAEMHAVSAQLDELDDGDPARQELLTRQEAIRSQLRSFDYDRQRPRAEVEAELGRLRAQFDSAKAQRIRTIKGRFTGADLAVGGKIPATDINRRIDASNRLEELEARIAHLENVLNDG